MLDGYVRVSQVAGRSGDRFISPKVQREQILGWAALHQKVLGTVFDELDESGGRADRPMLMRALERVENGESEGIVVAKLDRFGRSLIDGLAEIALARSTDTDFDLLSSERLGPSAPVAWVLDRPLKGPYARLIRTTNTFKSWTVMHRWGP